MGLLDYPYCATCDKWANGSSSYHGNYVLGKWYCKKHVAEARERAGFKSRSFHSSIITAARKAWKKGKFHKIDIALMLTEQGHKCYYCKQEFLVKDGFHLFEFDHVVPVSRGGETTRDNLVLSCVKCNHSKGGMYSTPIDGVEEKQYLTF